MEGETVKAGTKIGRTVAKIDTVTANSTTAELAEIAKDLKCNPDSALSMLKSYIEKGIVTDNRIEAMVDVDTKIMFRKDFGENYAHPIKSHGYMTPVDHYNVDIQVRRMPGTCFDNWNLVGSLHIIIDAKGNIIDYFLIKRVRK
jgi:hypothetical protein